MSDYTVACFGILSPSDFKGAKIVNLDEKGNVQLILVDSYEEAHAHFSDRIIGIAIKNALIKLSNEEVVELLKDEVKKKK